MAQTQTTSPYVIDVDERTFEDEVIERSRQVPVVVDFWATWCGPCRTLSPVLEGLAQEHGGGFILAKVNVDENQQLSARYGVQSIPLIKAFKDGRVADEFVGAQPQPVVRQFIQRLIPGKVDREIATARSLLQEGKNAEAELAFRQILVQQPENLAAVLGLAKAALEQQREDEALALLATVPLGTPEGNEATRLQQQIKLRLETRGLEEPTLRARLVEAPGDLETRFQLAGLLAAQGRYEEALEEHLEVLRRNRSFRNGAARLAMLLIFETLGEQPLVRTYRNRMASVLFV